jgi:hypothetical protein
MPSAREVVVLLALLVIVPAAYGVAMLVASWGAPTVDVAVAFFAALFGLSGLLGLVDRA